MAAIAITTESQGPVTIPLASVNVLRKSKSGRAVIVFHNGSELEAQESYKQVSEKMTSVQVWGSVTTESA